MTYANIVYRRGIPRFYADARAAGADGVLIVDVPVEEADPFLDAARRTGIDPINIVAPTTSEPRIARIVAAGGGYVYVVSRAGVTGTRKHLSGGIADTLRVLRRHTDLPLAVGFGISTPAQVRSLCEAGADGVIIGSAFADIIGRHAHAPAVMLREIRRFSESLRDGIP
jgi:tryptophan synthase alpha chain